MDFPAREQLERRIHAMVADHLDSIAEDHPQGFELGTIALVFDVWYPDEDYDGTLNRVEADYLPPKDVDTQFSYYVSDQRWWVKVAVFREAYEFYVAHYSNADGASEDDDDEGADE